MLPTLKSMESMSSWLYGIPQGKKIMTVSDLSVTLIPMLFSSALQLIPQIPWTTYRKRYDLYHSDTFQLVTCSMNPVDLGGDALLPQPTHHSRRMQEGSQA